MKSTTPEKLTPTKMIGMDADMVLRDETTWIRFREQAWMLLNQAKAMEASLAGAVLGSAFLNIAKIGEERGLLDGTGEWKKGA